MFNGYRVVVEEDEKFWRWMVVMVVQQCEWYLTPLNDTL